VSPARPSRILALNAHLKPLSLIPTPCSSPEVREKTKEVTAEARAKAHELGHDAKVRANELSHDARAEAQKLYGDAKNAAHTASGEVSGAARDVQSKGYDALAKGENKANASLLSQAENKGKSLWSGAQAEADRLSGHVKGDAAELKEVSRVALRRFPLFTGNANLFTNSFSIRPSSRLTERQVHVQVNPQHPLYTPQVVTVQNSSYRTSMYPLSRSNDRDQL
jgi:cell division septum initiation protein DivIVA